MKTTSPVVATARSSLPSPLKSPAAIEAGEPEPVGTEEAGPKATEEVGVVTVKNATYDMPPPGGGLTTVTDAVLAAAMSAAGTVAFNREPLMNWVASAPPFQCTTEPETNPVPFTVTLKGGPPG